MVVFKKICDPFSLMEFNYLTARANSRRQFYYLPLSSQKSMIVNSSNSEGWKAELTLDPPCGFEHGIPGLGMKSLNH